jgi:hypothetical protein
MPSQRRWRQRLLGSLQGQLQLATYLVVFAGLTGASMAGLWVGQRNLIHNKTCSTSNPLVCLEHQLLINHHSVSTPP